MKKILSFLAVFLFVFTGCGNGEDGNVEVSSDTDVTYSKGNANAQVIITQFSDYECPFCADFSLQVLPQIQKDYIETGKVRFVFKDYPVQNHKFAQKASEATYCAGEQDESLFWQMHIDLYSDQTNLSRENLSKLAEKYGINVQAFDACLDNGRYRNLVLRNRQEGKNKGVSATPTFFVNETKMVGVQPYENIKKVIDTELTK